MPVTVNRTVKIADIADAKPGDVIRYSYRGHEAEGVAWQYSSGQALYVGRTCVLYSDTPRLPEDIKIVSITREVPPRELPTEPGSIIRWGVFPEIGYVAILDSDGTWWVLETGTWRGPERLRDLIRGVEWVELVPKAVD
jgi:hypothetical protein